MTQSLRTQHQINGRSKGRCELEQVSHPDKMTATDTSKRQPTCKQLKLALQVQLQSHVVKYMHVHAHVHVARACDWLPW